MGLFCFGSRHAWSELPCELVPNGRRASETASMPGGTPIMLRISLIWSLAEMISCCCCCSFSASSSDWGTEDMLRHLRAGKQDKQSCAI